jgi:UDPglucose--hexose-1-phosphate uridylyltransferase
LEGTELRRRAVATEILDPRLDFAATRVEFELRWDPLTGQTSRIRPSVPLLKPADELERLAEETRATCPFCPERIEDSTPKLPPAILPEGRIRRGDAVPLPNLRLGLLARAPLSPPRRADTAASG